MIAHTLAKIAITFLILRFLFRKRFKSLLENYRRNKFALKIVKDESAKFGLDLDDVKLAFVQNFLEGKEKGSQLTLTLNGEVILDLQGGRDEESVFSSMTMVFSCSKVIESLVVAMLIDQQKIRSYEDPISLYWPEFGKRYSETVSIKQLMQHQAGLEEINEPLTLREATELFASPQKIEEWIFRSFKIDDDIHSSLGITSRYHAITRGIFVDLLCVKTDGRRMRDFVAEEIVRKLDDKQVQYFLGCPSDFQKEMATCEGVNVFVTLYEILLHKLGIVSTFIFPKHDAGEEDFDEYYRNYLSPAEVDLLVKTILPNSRHRKSLVLVKDVGLGVQYLANSAEFRALPLPSVTGTTNSSSLAKITAELACGGGKLLSHKGLEKAMQVDEKQGQIFDELLNMKLTYSNNGWSTDRLGKDWVGWAYVFTSIFMNP